MNNLPINYNELTKRCLELQTEIKDLNKAIVYYRNNIETYKQLYNLKQEKSITIKNNYTFASPMNTEKLIQIIESCLTYEQFLTSQNIVERHIFTSERECNIVMNKLTEKENQLKTQTNV